MTAFFRKLTERRIWERILRERLSEPLHLNLMALWVQLFGSFESKVYFDLVIRQSNAFCLLQAATFAREKGYSAITAVEFGVASGAGLLNMAEIAKHVTKATGVRIELVGFDTGKGMPPPIDYRDHPDLYGSGDFPMQDYEGLRARLPSNARLIIGEIAATLEDFLAAQTETSPIGFVVIDVDYYSSAVDCLKIFDGPSNLYLPETLAYFDDIHMPQHNPWQGEYLAIDEFNKTRDRRKISPFNFLRNYRLFKQPMWIDQIYLVHVLDHRHKSRDDRKSGARVLSNPYLK